MTDTTILIPGGIAIDIAKPSLDMFDSNEQLCTAIQFSLEGLNRYTGHTRWSVMQHSRLVSQIATSWYGPEVALWGLLHDAHEFVLGDMSRPLRNVMEQFPWPRSVLQSLRMLADEWDRLIWDRLTGLPMPSDTVRAQVKYLDKLSVQVELDAFIHSKRLSYISRIYGQPWSESVDMIGSPGYYKLQNAVQKLVEQVKAKEQAT